MMRLLEDTGKEIIFRTCGLEMKLDKRNAHFSSIKWEDEERNLLYPDSRNRFFRLDYRCDGKSGEFIPQAGDWRYECISETEDMAEVMGVNEASSGAPFQIELHFAVRRGISGVYVYSVYRYPENMPGHAELVEDRCGLYMSEEIFDEYKIRIDDYRPILPARQLQEAEEVMDATYRLKDGSVYSRYFLINKEEDNGVYGLFGKGAGAFVIKPCGEYYNGSPMHCELAAYQTVYSPVLLWHGHSCHYGRTPICPEKGWSKVFGPALFYFNRARNMDEAWDDAAALCEQEKKKWPYSWVTAGEYEKDSRCRVTGRLNLTDAFTKAYILLVPAEEDWQNSCMRDSYYRLLQKNGEFSFDYARQGAYRLHILAEGIFGEYTSDVISVSEDVDLGEITWSAPKTGKLLWEIGKPDFSSREFCRGGDFHTWGWEDYDRRFPDGVHYYVGRSGNYDFNYFQPVNQWGSKEPKYAAPWTIHFDCGCLHRGKARLTIAVAGKCSCDLNVDVNGVKFENVEFGGPADDASFYRSGVRGIWRHCTLEFDAAVLKKEGNVITLSVAPENTPWQLSYGAILYDYLKLEAEE